MMAGKAIPTVDKQKEPVNEMKSSKLGIATAIKTENKKFSVNQQEYIVNQFLFWMSILISLQVSNAMLVLTTYSHHTSFFRSETLVLIPFFQIMSKAT